MIPQYKKILFATDLSNSAATVLTHVVCLARAHDAQVEIVYVLPEVDQSVVNYVSTVMGNDRLADMEMDHKDDIAAQLSQKIRQFARDELADHPEDLGRIDRIEVLQGHPAPAILDESKRSKADLLVIGMHGKGRLEYAFLGSVAQRIMRRAEVPVLLVPLTP